MEEANEDGEGQTLAKASLPISRPTYIEVESKEDDTGSFERKILSALDQAGDRGSEAVESSAMSVGEASARGGVGEISSATGGIGDTSVMEEWERDEMRCNGKLLSPLDQAGD